MRLPAALVPLRHPLFRTLWIANVMVSMGVWMQNTGAGWLMTSLAPDAFTVSLVQAATIMPVFLLALPAGALADTVDKRLFIIATQSWMLLAASVLALLTFWGMTNAGSLLALTFAIGAGAAMNNPAWGTVMAEAVPRQDLVQAIALNGVGFNLARAIGPALAGVLLLTGGPALTFALNVLSYLAVIAVLVSWRRRKRDSALPRENLLSAMKAGMRYVRHTPTVRAAMLRSMAFFFAAAAPWAMLPLVVRQQLGLGAGTYGLLLGLMGLGGVTCGMVLPQVRARLSRGNTVFAAAISACLGMAILGLARHWAPAALGMMLFGIGWVAASAVTQGAAQLAAPAWVRSRALAIFQLAFNLALAAGTFFWGWVGTQFSLTHALLAAAGVGLVLAVLSRTFDIDMEPAALAAGQNPTPLLPEAVDPDLMALMRQTRDRVLEYQAYCVGADGKNAFLQAMAEVREVRGRSGAIEWQLYEDVAHAEGWLEIWAMETWTDHLREAGRMDEQDRASLARALAFHQGEPTPPRRYIAVAPHRLGLRLSGGHAPRATPVSLARPRERTAPPAR
jgi:MFS family permease